MKKIIYIAIAVMASVLLLCGCSEAARANSNISKQADYFESERKITVYNARTDKVIMEAEGIYVYLQQFQQRACLHCKGWPRYLQEKLHLPK